MAMVCRTCGQKVHVLNSKNLFDEDDVDIVKNIKIITGISITKQLDMPENICVTCVLDVNNAIDFRERCIKMHSQLMGQQRTVNIIDESDVESKATSLEDGDYMDPHIEDDDYDDLIYEVDEVEEGILEYPTKPEPNEDNDEDDDSTIPQMTAEDYALIYDDETQEDGSTASPATSVTSASIQFSSFRPRKRIPSNERKPRPNRKKPKEPFFCDQCGKSFWEKGNLVVHLKRHDAKQYECPDCGRKEFTAHLLNLHIRIKHKGELPYECKFCGLRFDNSLKRLKHERVVHIKYVFPRPYKCHICSKTFKDKTSFVKHGAIHTGEKPYQCDVCQTAFNQKRTLTNHYKSKQHQKNCEAWQNT